MTATDLGALGALIQPPPADAVPYPVSLRGPTRASGAVQLCTPIPDQYHAGSCLSQYIKHSLETLDGSGRRLSAQGLYLDTREFSRFQPHEDSGAYPEASMQAVSVRGVGSAALEPYDPDDIARPMSAEYREQALDHRLESWYRARRVTQVKAAVDAGFTVGMMMEVCAAFGQAATDGLWHDDDSPARGGHAVEIVAYDDDVVCTPEGQTGGFIVANWWRVGSWGLPIPGYPEYGRCSFRIPYAAYEGRRIFDALVMNKHDSTAGG